MTISNRHTMVARINGMRAIPPPGFSNSDMKDMMALVFIGWQGERRARSVHAGSCREAEIIFLERLSDGNII